MWHSDSCNYHVLHGAPCATFFSPLFTLRCIYCCTNIMVSSHTHTHTESRAYACVHIYYVGLFRYGAPPTPPIKYCMGITQLYLSSIFDVIVSLVALKATLVMQPACCSVCISIEISIKMFAVHSYVYVCVPCVCAAKRYNALCCCRA